LDELDSNKLRSVALFLSRSNGMFEFGVSVALKKSRFGREKQKNLLAQRTIGIEADALFNLNERVRVSRANTEKEREKERERERKGFAVGKQRAKSGAMKRTNKTRAKVNQVEYEREAAPKVHGGGAGDRLVSLTVAVWVPKCDGL
jgi:hypothetical protein